MPHRAAHKGELVTHLLLGGLRGLPQGRQALVSPVELDVPGLCAGECAGHPVQDVVQHLYRQRRSAVLFTSVVDSLKAARC